MSVTRPALQTLPRGKLVRDGFVSRHKKGSLVLVDYAQMELLLFIHYTQDPTMMAAAIAGEDLHQTVSDQIGISRQASKGVNYGLIYGATAKGLVPFLASYGVYLERSEVELIMQSYWARFASAQRWIASVEAEVRHSVNSEGFGRVKLWDGREPLVDADRAYTGVNYKIQGGCASLFKRKLVELDRAGLGEALVLPIHDEVMFDVPAKEAEDVMQLACATMNETERFSVPLTTEGTIVTRWGDKYA